VKVRNKKFSLDTSTKKEKKINKMSQQNKLPLNARKKHYTRKV
jgi:hypothetical protein